MNKDASNTVRFREEQKFRQPWVWALVLGLAAIAWVVMLGQARPNQPPHWALTLVGILIGIVLPLFFFSTKLITVVRDDGIYYKFFPFHFTFRRIPWNKLERYEVRIYRPLRDYGGWGIRYGFSKGWAYTISGNRGLRLELASGRKLLIGTQKPDELALAILDSYGQAKGKPQSSPVAD